MDREERLRAQLRARAWDVLSALPDGLELAGPLEHAECSGDLEVVITVRRRGQAPAPPAAGVLPLGPLQRFLPGCFLTDLERAVIDHLEACRPARRTRALLREQLEGRLATPVSEGVLFPLLSRMTDQAVGILDNDKGAEPPGYQITAAYREFRAWAAAAARTAARTGAA